MSNNAFVRYYNNINSLSFCFQSEKTDVFKIFVGGIPKEATQNDIYNYFKIFGEILRIDLKSDHIINQNRGFGFLLFKEKKVIDLVLEKKPHFIFNKQIEVELAIPKKEITKSEIIKEKKEIIDFSDRKLYVKGLKNYITEKDLVNCFSKFGKIDECFIKRNKNISRGFGFIIFKNKQSVEHLSNSKVEIKIKGTIIKYEKAIPKYQIDNDETSTLSSIVSENNTEETLLDKKSCDKKLSINSSNFSFSNDSSLIAENKTFADKINSPIIKSSKIFNEILFLPNSEDSSSNNFDILNSNDKYSSFPEEDSYEEKMIDEKVMFETNKLIESLDDDFYTIKV